MRILFHRERRYPYKGSTFYHLHITLFGRSYELAVFNLVAPKHVLTEISQYEFVYDDTRWEKNSYSIPICDAIEGTKLSFPDLVQLKNAERQISSAVDRLNKDLDAGIKDINPELSCLPNTFSDENPDSWDELKDWWRK